MAVSELGPLVEAAQAEEQELVAKQGELTTARDELNAAQAVVDEKQGVVNQVSSELATEKADVVAAVNAVMSKCQEILQTLQG